MTGLLKASIIPPVYQEPLRADIFQAFPGDWLYKPRIQYAVSVGRSGIITKQPYAKGFCLVINSTRVVSKTQTAQHGVVFSCGVIRGLTDSMHNMPGKPSAKASKLKEPYFSRAPKIRFRLLTWL
jgi:hypothetical protein